MTKTTNFDPFAGAALSDVIPMTPSQKELWMGAQQSPQASCAYNLSISVMLNGKLDSESLSSAMQQLVDRHDGLRASFSSDTMSMCIAESLDVDLPTTDLRDLEDAEQADRIAEILRADVATPFDLVFGPLWRVHLLRLSPVESRLVLTLHHLVADGWTVDLLVKELAAFYSATVSGREVDLPPSYQFRDYAAWLEEEYASEQGLEADRFWLEKFETKAPVLELPVDRPRQRMRSFSAARTEVVLEGDAAGAIFDAATKLKNTFFIFAFTNYVAFLNRITGQNDFVIAVPAAGQLDVGENLLAGHCVNTLPMRCTPPSDVTFEELLQQTRRDVYAANGHTPFTFGNLLGRIDMERDTSRPPLASTLITVDQEGHDLDFEGLTASYRLNPRAFENFELQIALVAQKDRIEIQCQYNTDLFDEQTANRRMREFATLLTETARDPQQKIADIPLVSPDDAEKIAKWNDTTVEYRKGCTLHGLFAEQVAKTPDNVALEFLGETMTYAEFDARSNQLANYLLDCGVKPGQAVGVCTQRSFEMFVSLYAVIKAGGAYVPFDPDYPRDRLEFILEDSGADVVLVQDEFRNLIPSDQNTVFCVDSQWTEIEALPTTVSSPEIDDTSLAYTIYTSGSTGKPKGVMNEHRGICNQLFWMQEKFALDGSDNILLKTPYSFDVSIWELFFPLLNGARVVIAPPDAHRDPQQLSDLFRDSKITGTCFVPSLLSAYLSGVDAQPHDLRWIISIGEAMTPDLQSRFIKQLPGVELHNLYGPTEAAVGVTHWLCEERANARSVPIGRPFANVVIYILDANRNPVPIGASGELYIGGVQVARGYHNREELNAEVFVDDPFSDVAGAKMYKTGDLSRWTNDGVIEYLGRVDFQVKFAGLRIELGEIESILEEHSSVDNSVVIVHEPDTEAQKLVAYYSTTSLVDKNELREHLGKKLPQYMIPQIFMELESLPLNTAGKVDRKSLPAPVAGPSIKAKQVAMPENDIERALAETWEEFLQIDDVPLHETFFDLGGTSLQALRLVSQLAKTFDTQIPVIKFFEYPTIAQFGAWLAEQGGVHVPVVAAPKPEDVVVELSTVRTTHSRDVAIVGVAGSFPDAPDVETFWKHLLETRDSIRHFDADEIDPIVDPQIAGRPNYVRARGVMPDIDKFDAKLFGIRPREAQIMDPQQRVFMETCWHALEDAAIDTNRVDGKVGVFAGTGDNKYLMKYVLRDNSAIDSIGEHQVHILNETDFLTSRVAYKLNLRGPAVSVATACSTSLVAICHAVESIRAGQCDTALAGGVSIPPPQHSGYLYQEGGIGSADGACRPFDADADGTVFSSGTGAVVLRRRDVAEANGDRIYGVIRGVALNNDGADKMSFMAPSATGQREVIAAALHDAGVDGNDVSYVEAHGTATPIGDPIEFSALTSAYGISQAGERWLGSVKSNIGHLDIAAGIAGFIKVAKTLHSGLLPGTVNFKTPNPEIDLDAFGFSVPTATFNWKDHKDTLRAGISSFGIGGTNAHVIVESPTADTRPMPGRSQEMLFISADSESQLQALGSRVADHLDGLADNKISDAAYTMARGRRRLGYRTFAAGSAQDIVQSLSAIKENCITAQPVTDASVAFVFPGQGSQHIGMGKGLYEHSAIFREVFDQGAVSLAAKIGVDLRDLLFNKSVGDSEAIEMLTRTRVAQPAIYLLQYALARHWMSWGLQPSAVAGHSIGEFAAATVAGIMSFETGLKLVEARGRLIQEMPGGTMLSVRAARSVIEPFLNEDLSLAAVNAPELCVVSGSDEAVDGLAKRFEQSGILAKPLVTSHAFHSPMMEPARRAFEDVVASCKLSPPSLKFVSTLTGQEIADAEAVDPSYWGQQLRYGVNFSDAVKTIWTGRKPILLEVGPRATATTLAKQQMTDHTRERAVASLGGADTAAKEWAGVLGAAGELWANGVELDWGTVYEKADRQVVSMPGYPFRRTRYWMGEAAQEAAETPSLEAPEVVAGDPIADRIRSLVERGSGFVLTPGDVNRTFIDIGLDSLYLTQFGIQLQNEFAVHVGLRDLIETYSSVASLAGFITANSVDERSAAPAGSVALDVPRKSLPPAHLPPCEGAFVGRDEHGSLAWYREEPEQPGRFEKIKVAS